MKFASFQFWVVLSVLSQVVGIQVGRADGQPPAGSGVTILNPKISEGAIQIRQVPLDVTAGYGGHSLKLKAAVGSQIFLFAEDSSYGSSNNDYGSVFVLDLTPQGEIQISTRDGSVLDYRFATPSVGLFAYKGQYNLNRDDNKVTMEGGFSAELASVLYESASRKAVGLRLNNALFEFLKLHGQVAFQVSGVNVDLCGGMRGKARVGEVRVKNGPESMASVGLAAEACLGVQLGVLGNLRDEFSFEFLQGAQNTSYTVVSNLVRLDQIGGSPVGLYWENRRDWSNSGGEVPERSDVSGNFFGITLRGDVMDAINFFRR